MDVENFQESVAIWLPLITAVITLLFTAYGVHRAWQEQRIKRAETLFLTAQTAVRITEAAYVRPLLKQRLDDIVKKKLIPT